MKHLCLLPCGSLWVISKLWSYSQVEVAAELSDHVIRLSFVISMFVFIFSITTCLSGYSESRSMFYSWPLLPLHKKLSAILCASSIKGRVSLKSEWMNRFLFLWHFSAALSHKTKMFLKRFLLHWCVICVVFTTVRLKNHTDFFELLWSL